VDLLAEGGLDGTVSRTGDIKFGFATKAQSLLTGWDRKWIPDRVVHLDVDIVVAAVTDEHNLNHVFEPLDVSILKFCAKNSSSVESIMTSQG
jgi:hypothetical protein